MKNILNEWRKNVLNEGNRGLYQLVGLPEGTIDNFLFVFVDATTSLIKTSDWAKEQYSEEETDKIVNGAIEQGLIPEEMADQAFKGIRAGWTYWWDLLLGRQEAKRLVEFQVDIWLDLMKKNMTANKGMAKHEFMFFLDYLEAFFQNDVSQTGTRGTSKMSNRGERVLAGYGQPAALYGQLQDWYIGRPNGLHNVFLGAMKNAMNELDSWRKDPEVRKTWL